jgi:hypothetical protein
VNRTGFFRFNVLVKFPKGFDFTGNLFCDGNVFHFNSTTFQTFTSQRSIPMNLGNKRATCSLLIPFAWNGADDGGTISPGLRVFSSNPEHGASDQTVFFATSLPDQPMPIFEDNTTVFEVDAQM